MSKAGMKGRVELLVGAGHGWMGPNDLFLLKHTFDETYAFFEEHLKPEH